MAARRPREKPYVCVDIDLPRNDRLFECREPAACLGLWLALAAYTREHLTTDGTSGRVPKGYADSLWGDRKNPSRLSDMCKAGLLGDDGTHYLVLRYAPRNQTREDVEEARRAARERMARRRGGGGFTQDVRANNVRTGGERTPFVPTSTSDPDSDLDLPPDPDARARVTPNPMRRALHDAWNEPPPDVASWTPQNTNVSLFGELAVVAGPLHDRDGGEIGAFARRVVDAIVAVHAKWAPGGGAPALSPDAYARPKWWPRVQEAMTRGADRVGPPAPRATVRTGRGARVAVAVDDGAFPDPRPGGPSNA